MCVFFVTLAIGRVMKRWRTFGFRLARSERRKKTSKSIQVLFSEEFWLLLESSQNTSPPKIYLVWHHIFGIELQSTHEKKSVNKSGCYLGEWKRRKRIIEISKEERKEKQNTRSLFNRKKIIDDINRAVLCVSPESAVYVHSQLCCIIWYFNENQRYNG